MKEKKPEEFEIGKTFDQMNSSDFITFGPKDLENENTILLLPDSMNEDEFLSL